MMLSTQNCAGDEPLEIMNSKLTSDNTVLAVENLCVDFKVKGKVIHILSDISFNLSRGETLGIIGESGCGKSMTALALMRMVPSPPGWISGGRILMCAENLIRLSEKEMRTVRGRQISMIFQEPMTALNPVYSVGNQIAETIRCHKDRTKSEGWEEAVEMLRVVQIPHPERIVREYPHQLSGGMRQRVMIAMALACEPKVLIADEPTTALDVTVQAQIFDLLKEMQEARGTCMILITHDFGAVAEMADRVMVMYAGHKIEEGTVEEIRNDARHPYTKGLLQCMPEIRIDIEGTRERLPEIPGTVPDLLRGLTGCPFAPRCSFTMSKCKELPPSFELGNKRSVNCWLARADIHVKEPAG
jgi:peptide/nickel transport system ATP-binding protein